MEFPTMKLGALASLFCAALIAASRAGAADISPGLRLSYRGDVARLSADKTPGEPEKTFDLWLLVGSQTDDARMLSWMVEESGRGQAEWNERFGTCKLDGNLTAADNSVPTLLYDRDGQPSEIEIPLPMLKPSTKLTQDATWSIGKSKFVIDGQERLEDRDCWRIAVSNEYGRARTVWFDKPSGLVAGINQRVFMGQGEEYQLRLRLVSSAQLPAGELAQQVADFQTLIELRNKLGAIDGSSGTALSESQRAALAKLLPAAEQAIKSAPLAKIVLSAKQALTAASDRADRIAELVAKFQGEPVEKFEITGPNSIQLTDADLAGHVTVLHFWDYRDEPLREPYGQIGYLDFLYAKRKPDKVQVYGVAVNGRFGDEGQRAAAARSVDRLLRFMNLSYPVLYDDGRLLKQFGDPRIRGGQLPLFVVIGPDRKIVHYFVGCYDIDRDAGLKQLDQVLTETLKLASP